jgi:chromosome segregation protein
MDIQELLSDTGMGRAHHTIVGQGQLDSVLSARPEERRQFIEEAAGIAKHRRRRERTERKFDALEVDLNRLQDLVGELRRQLKPLKQQAELAGRHEALTTEAADLAVKLAAARLRDLLDDRERRAPAWADMESKERTAHERLAHLDSEIARLDGERAVAESRHAESEGRHQAALESKSRADEALRQAIREESRSREHLAQAENRSGRLFALEDELRRTEGALAEVRPALEARERELGETEAAFRVARQARQDAEDERRRRGEEVAVRRAEAEALRRAVAGHDAELERLAAALADLRDRADRAEARVGELGVEIERLDAAGASRSDRATELERVRADLAGRAAELEAEEQGLLARQEVVDARQAELSESPGAAFLRLRGRRAIGMLRDLIDAPPDLWPAIRGALGSHADAVVYADRDAAVADAEHGGPGAVTLAVEHEIPLMPAAIHTERRLIEALRYDPRAAGLVVALLGEIYLVGNLAEASAKHRVHPYASFVTSDGTVVGPSVVRTAPGGDARLEGVRRQSAALERELAAVRRGLREGRAELAGVATELATVRTELEEHDRLLTAAAEEQAAFQAELTARRREEQLVGEREAAVRAAAGLAREQLATLGLENAAADLPPLPPMPEPPVTLRVEVEALRRDRARLEAGVDRSRAEVAALAAEDPIRLRDVVREAEAVRAGAEAELQEAEQALADALGDYRSTAEAARTVQAEHAEANRAWREGSASLEALRRDHEEEVRTRHDLERRMADAERLLREGHGAEPAEAVATLAPEDTVEELQRRADLVARRLGLLGRVNLLAAGELESLQERHDFLVRELEDVRAARRDLQEVIRQLDVRMVELFGAAFRDVAREFSALFETMFPGGEGRLVLLDPDDPLSSGIEVEARPGRGRVKRLSLLSGGERSLAALAFLFAIFRARPSPFYLMDEVEAALDDVNLHRFLEVIREFAATSQILVVTHQKRTMETADVLYGVSMGRDGVSRVLSQRLAEAAVSTP